MDQTLGKIDQQISFISEIDKLKQVERRAKPVGLSRRENSAEHSWHVLVAALMLHEHANEKVNLPHVLKMLAIHDVVEIDAGDTFHFHKAGKEELAKKEQLAAERLFGMLPSEQASQYLSMWREFEARETPEARFAAAVDRFMPILLNFHNKGGSWVEYGLSAEEVLKATAYVGDGSQELWRIVQDLLERTVDSGFIQAKVQQAKA
jgi:putative hydrolase of HD superfamily